MDTTTKNAVHTQTAQLRHIPKLRIYYGHNSPIINVDLQSHAAFREHDCPTSVHARPKIDNDRLKAPVSPYLDIIELRPWQTIE